MFFVTDACKPQQVKTYIAKYHEVDQLIATYTEGHFITIAGKIAHALSEAYPDVTWVVMVFKNNDTSMKRYSDYNGFPSDACYIKDYYSKGVCVAHLTTPTATTDNGYSVDYKLSKSYSPACDGDYDIDLDKTLHSTAFHLQNNFKVNISSMFMFAQDSGHEMYIARKDSHTGSVYSEEHLDGTLSWDRRVGTYTGSTCTKVLAVLLER